MIHLQRKDGEKTECLLCPHYCSIGEGKSGICGVRRNNGGKIELQTYGVLSACSLDPVEKKPLYHYFPGYNILSVGSYGCNMRCDFCQNYNISQTGYEAELSRSKTSPEDLVIKAERAERNIGLAFTYNEPVIWFEYMRDAALLAKNRGLYTIMVSNGYVNKEPLSEIIDFIDAFNIDLKAFNDAFYKKMTGAGIEPVKKALKMIARSDRHLEITTLVIPGLNDSEKEMKDESEWIASELGKDTPLHLSRYFPMYKRNNPITSDETLLRLHEIASRILDHVYIGNTRSCSGQDTICPFCGITVTERSGYKTKNINLDKEGKCTGCGNLIYKNYTISSSFE